MDDITDDIADGSGSDADADLIRAAVSAFRGTGHLPDLLRRHLADRLEDDNYGPAAWRDDGHYDLLPLDELASALLRAEADGAWEDDEDTRPLAEVADVTLLERARRVAGSERERRLDDLCWARVVKLDGGDKGSAWIVDIAYPSMGTAPVHEVLGPFASVTAAASARHALGFRGPGDISVADLQAIRESLSNGARARRP